MLFLYCIILYYTMRYHVKYICIYMCVIEYSTILHSMIVYHIMLYRSEDLEESSLESTGETLRSSQASLGAGGCLLKPLI